CPSEVLRVLGIGQRVLHMHDGSREDRTSGHELAARPYRVHLMQRPETFRRVVVMGSNVYQFAVEAAHEAVQAIAQTYSTAHNGVEHRLNVCWRTADDAQDLRSRRLLFRALSQRASHPFDLALEIRVRPASGGVRIQRCPALWTELGRRRVLLLASGTRH